MKQHSETVRILNDLIAFPSVSSRSNLDIIGFIEDYLAKRGVASQRIYNNEKTKASLLASIGPVDRGGIVLSAHTDVVPVEGQNWSSPPFTATFVNGRVVGRGATDMKGFLACVMAHAELFKTSAKQTPVHLAFSYDEEVGCLGAPALVEAIAARQISPALCIVGEPTGLRVVNAHKGKVAKRVIFTGQGGHSALPHRGTNAAFYAARLATMLADFSEETAYQGFQDAAFEPPYTSIHLGSIHSGTALNFVPDRATIEFEIRDIPGENMPALLAKIDAYIAHLDGELRNRAPGAGISVEHISGYPSMTTPAAGAAVMTTRRLADTGAPPGTVSFGTEGGLYAAAKIPTVVCGPGDIGRAHKADEWIGLDELAAADRMMERLAGQLARPAEEWIK